MGVAEYYTLSAVLAVFTIALHWSFIDSLRPSTRFHLLAPEIDYFIEMIDKNRDLGGGSGKAMMVAKECILILAQLDRLGIKVPEDQEALIAMFPVLGAMSETKDLKNARKLRYGKHGIYVARRRPNP